MGTVGEVEEFTSEVFRVAEKQHSDPSVTISIPHRKTSLTGTGEIMVLQRWIVL